MAGFPSPFGGGDDGDLFDEYGEFVPANVPEPGAFLEGHRLLTGDDHVAFHEITRDCFEARKVYDMTFNYNLARLNLDTRHRGAGYRYAEEVETGEAAGEVETGEAAGEDDQEAGSDPVAAVDPIAESETMDGADAFDDVDDPSVLRAEFTPTTPFCPQTHTLTIGSFRAWNGLADRHEYDLVRVRAAPMHHQSEAINDQLTEIEERYLETGSVHHEPEGEVGEPASGGDLGPGGPRLGDVDAPF